MFWIYINHTNTIQTRSIYIRQTPTSAHHKTKTLRETGEKQKLVWDASTCSQCQISKTFLLRGGSGGGRGWGAEAAPLWTWVRTLV